MADSHPDPYRQLGTAPVEPFPGHRGQGRGPGTGRLEVPVSPPEKQPEKKPEKEPVASKPPEKEPEPPIPPEKKPAPAPRLEVVKIEPAEPKAGERLLVQTKLTHPDGGKLRLQYRLEGEQDWKEGTGDRLELPRVNGPLLVLQMRAIDEAGKT